MRPVTVNHLLLFFIHPSTTTSSPPPLFLSLCHPLPPHFSFSTSSTLQFQERDLLVVHFPFPPGHIVEVSLIKTQKPYSGIIISVQMSNNKYPIGINNVVKNVKINKVRWCTVTLLHECECSHFYRQTHRSSPTTAVLGAVVFLIIV